MELATAVQLLTGERLRVSTDGSGDLLGVTSSVEFFSEQSTRDFGCAAVGYFETACKDIVPAKLVSRSILDGFELRVAHGDEGLVTLGALRGKAYELLTVFGGPAIDEHAVAAAFAPYDVAEGPNGFTMKANGVFSPSVVPPTVRPFLPTAAWFRSSPERTRG